MHQRQHGVLILCFSIGLAMTLVAVGAAAAIGARQAQPLAVARYRCSSRTYLSSVFIIGVGLYVGIHGWISLNAVLFDLERVNVQTARFDPVKA